MAKAKHPEGPKSYSKGKANKSVPGKERIHPHTKKALNAVAINSGIKNAKGRSTNNGISAPDERY